jgi:hypothetical protein|tara:strand:- start:56561 stop:56929 length:369 start_codon:yes stop_codon:yes gene_type:complete
MSGLRDILELQKRQHSRYNALRNDILKKMSDKIRHLSKHGELRCVYTVPSYTFGFPTYNVAEITTFLFTVLKNEGFCVVLLSDDKIFASWDINDINSLKKSKIKKKVEIKDIKHLINIDKRI